jgi:hypothetical protein
VAANAAALSALGALLAIVTFLVGFASTRLHGAYRDALRDLRESLRRLDTREPGHTDSRLDTELRWLAEVRDAARDSRWRESAILTSLLCAAAVTLGVWILTEDVRTIDAAAVLALTVAAVLVTILMVLDGLWIRAALAATVQRSPLWGVLRLESLLTDTYRATVRMRNAHRAWLQILTSGYPLAGLLGRWRLRRCLRASRRRDAAADRLAKWSAADTVLRDLTAAGVRPPAGYVEGLRGLLPLVARMSAMDDRALPRLDDDDEWDAALDHLNRAVELDHPRRVRWLAALAACAELRDDPVARESAARWTLEMAGARRTDTPGSMRYGPAGIAPDRFDPLPDAAVVEPRRPDTWEGALRRARETGAQPWLLASVLVHWAYALVVDRPRAPDMDRTAAPDVDLPAAPDVDAAIAPAVDAAVEIMGLLPEPEVDRYLRLVRAGLSELGVGGVHMSRLVPPRVAVHAPIPAAAGPPAPDLPTPPSPRSPA